MTGVFPFVQPAPFETTYLGQTIKEVTFGGVLAWPSHPVDPAVLRAVFWALRFKTRSTRTIAGVIIALLFGGVLVALMDAQMAGILQRYYADFSFMFLAASVLLAFIVNENLRPGSTAQVLLMKGLLTLVCISVLYVALLCFVPETGWFSRYLPLVVSGHHRDGAVLDLGGSARRANAARANSHYQPRPIFNGEREGITCNCSSRRPTRI